MRFDNLTNRNKANPGTIDGSGCLVLLFEETAIVQSGCYGISVKNWLVLSHRAFKWYKSPFMWLSVMWLRRFYSKESRFDVFVGNRFYLPAGLKIGCK